MLRHVSPVRPVPSLPANRPPTHPIDALLALVLASMAAPRTPAVAVLAIIDGFQRALEAAVFDGRLAVADGARAIGNLSMLRAWRSNTHASWVTAANARRHVELLEHVESVELDSTLSELVRFVSGIEGPGDAQVIGAAVRRFLERHAFDRAGVETFLGTLMHLVPDEHALEAETLLEHVGMERGHHEGCEAAE